jgi:hypothetical protein
MPITLSKLVTHIWKAFVKQKPKGIEKEEGEPEAAQESDRVED